jgi:hypothetical protein
MAPQSPNDAPDSPTLSPTAAAPGTARDREMGRDAAPLGDLGHGTRTWTPPAGQQGISNRPQDGDESGGTRTAADGRTSLPDGPAAGVPSQQGNRGHGQDDRPDDERNTREDGGRS